MTHFFLTTRSRPLAVVLAVCCAVSDSITDACRRTR